MIKHVVLGFGEALREKDPQRLQSFLRACDARIRGAGMYADENTIDLTNLLESRNKQQGGCNETYAILEESTDIPEGGIEFELQPELHKKVPKALLSSVRRFHFNSGHPPNNELERIVRLSGGSQFARAAVRGIRCII